MSDAKSAAAPRGPQTHARWIDALVLLVYVALSLAASWPLPAHLATHVPGRQADARVFQWNNWWVRHALLAPGGPQNLLYTDRFYYPTGASLAGHNLNWVSSLLSVPLAGLVGPTVAYNLLFTLTLWGSGFATYLLVRYVTGRRDAAFIAGLVFAFFPYRLSGNWDGQMNLANAQWLPLALLFLLRTVDHKRVRDGMLCGLFVALAGLDCWFYLPFLGLWGGAWLPYSLIWERRKWNGRLVALLAGAALLSGLLIAPALWPLLGQGDQQATVDEAVDYFAEQKASDLWAFFVPSSDHPLLGARAAPAYARFAHWRPAFVSYSVVALALYAILRALLPLYHCEERSQVCHCEERSDEAIPNDQRWGLLRRPRPRLAMTGRQALLWAGSAVLFAWLALGITLRAGGVEHPHVPMLLAGLIKVLPAFKLIRQPSRFNVMLGLSLSVLVGLACADLFARLSRRRLRAGLGALLSAAILFEFLAWPCPLLPARVSPWYERLAQEPGDFALVELPLGQLTAGHVLYGQTVHGKRLVNGYVARAASDVNPFVLSNPLLKAFYLRIEPDPRLHDLDAALKLLAANGVRYVAIHKGPLPPLPAVEEAVLEDWRRTLAGLGLEPIYEDGELAAYPTGPGLDRAGWPAAEIGSGLQVASFSTRRVEHGGRHQLQIDLVWRATRDLTEDLDLTLSLLDPVGARSSRPDARSGPWRISPHYPTSLWREGVVVAEQYALPLDANREGGAYTLALEVSGTDGADPVRAEVPVRLPAQTQPLAASLEVDHPADVTFGAQMRLLGYGWDEGALDVCWLAVDAMGTNWKIFVHLLSEGDTDGSGEIAAQADTMPRGWSYPTTLWSRQELFCDRIPLPLGDLTPGSYRAALGVYRPETGRLPAIDGEGRRLADDRAILAAPLVVPGP